MVHTLHFAINDIFMVFFFGIATKEIVEATKPGGSLANIKNALNPLIATMGGILVPIGVYIITVFVMGKQESLLIGFGIPTATDIAIAWMIASLIFGKKHPAIQYLLLLAIVDDALGLGIIAIFYPDPNHPVELQNLLFLVLGVFLSFGFKKARIENFWWYIIFGGGLSWIGLYTAHLHPALALVPIIPFIPSATKDEGLFAEEERREVSGHMKKNIDPLNQFEHFFKTPIEVGLFVFALVNAGVLLSSIGDSTYPVMFGLMIGKFMGVFGFAFTAHLLGIKLPKGIRMKELFVLANITGIGLTVALFVSGAAFINSDIQASAKMGVLIGSSIMIILSFLSAKTLKIKKTT